MYGIGIDTVISIELNVLVLVLILLLVYNVVTHESAASAFGV